MTTPHAWRIAFLRYFPGSDASKLSRNDTRTSSDDRESFLIEKRVFARLTIDASWRSEYILRTQLLRSLGRGRPGQIQLSGLGQYESSRWDLGGSGAGQITYNPGLLISVNRIDASFGASNNKRPPRFIFGADDVGCAMLSGPHKKINHWGLSDPKVFLRFATLFPGEAEYGLGDGHIVGLPNSMDVSHHHGMVYIEGLPGGDIYFRSPKEERGRHLRAIPLLSLPHLGIPRLLSDDETPCSVWIAKTARIPDLTDGLVGILSGSSSGIVSCYSLGAETPHGRRLGRGQVTARWALSPGVPIVAIAADNDYSDIRSLVGRIWAVVINALGEVFYLDKIPHCRTVGRERKLNALDWEELAWETGRTVRWELIELTHRVAVNDPFKKSDRDGSYSPRSSWNGTDLSEEQIRAETHEIEDFIRCKPEHFRQACDGWDMRRKLEVDFAGGDDKGTGEAIFVVNCGLDDGQTASIKKYTRCWMKQESIELQLCGSLAQPSASLPESDGSLPSKSQTTSDNESIPMHSARQSSIQHETTAPVFPTPVRAVEEWRASTLSFGGIKGAQITAIAVDMSTTSGLMVLEDPWIHLTNSTSKTSTPVLSTVEYAGKRGLLSEIPGQRARLLAAGTKLGAVLVWNMRAPLSKSMGLTNTVKPVRIIHTDSPQISSLALSSLYLVHGGNDGLVQAWDPLVSSTQPIRTLTSRISSRARRRIMQAAQGVEVNLNILAAGAICLDPDPTMLRGMVSIGGMIRYWCYSSSDINHARSSRRRPRWFDRESNQGSEKFGPASRNRLKAYIEDEKLDREVDEQIRCREQDRLAERFGLGLLGPGAGEDEILAYATILSEESAISDDLKRSTSDTDSDSRSDSTMVGMSSPLDTVKPEYEDEKLNVDIAEAIRLSLKEPDHPSAESSIDIPIKYVKRRGGKASTGRLSSGSPPMPAVASSQTNCLEVDDLRYALQLSLADENPPTEVEQDFPSLPKSGSPSPPGGPSQKGKRRSS